MVQRSETDNWEGWRDGEKQGRRGKRDLLDRPHSPHVAEGLCIVLCCSEEEEATLVKWVRHIRRTLGADSERIIATNALQSLYHQRTNPMRG